MEPIPTIKTSSLLKEFSTTKSAPMKFLTQGHGVYFVKYIQTADEFDNLVYEVLSQKLALHFGIPVPEAAFIEVIEGSFDENDLKKNRGMVNDGEIAFGSKAIGDEEPDTLDNTGRFSISTKTDFNRIRNPKALIRIAIFDVHLDNQDRNEDNYNILLKRGKKEEYYAIDHFAAFGSSIWRRNIDESQMEPIIHNKLLKSKVFHEIVKFFDHQTLTDELDQYFYLCNQDMVTLIHEVFAQIPHEWCISGDLKERIVNLLASNERNKKAKEAIKGYFSHLKSR